MLTSTTINCNQPPPPTTTNCYQPPPTNNNCHQPPRARPPPPLQSLARSSWALATLGHNDSPAFMEALLEAAQPLLPDLKPQVG